MRLTNLEALECIIVDLTPIVKEHDKEEIEQLKKSLEVLEILKNYSYSNDHSILFIALDCMKSNELEKIMEWLEK